MKTLIFATNNPNKILEIRALLPTDFQLITLAEAGIDIDIPEPHPTIAENATEKAKVIFALTNKDCFGEDTGLEVEALGGEPGVLSARYAGVQANSQNNIALLLQNMTNELNRKAQFKTVISLYINGEEKQFMGICEGSILTKPIGELGFGYDAIFVPNGSIKSFAEMELVEKNKYSHRKKAVSNLIAYLNTL